MRPASGCHGTLGTQACGWWVPETQGKGAAPNALAWGSAFLASQRLTCVLYRGCQGGFCVTQHACGRGTSARGLLSAATCGQEGFCGHAMRFDSAQQTGSSFPERCQQLHTLSTGYPDCVQGAPVGAGRPCRRWPAVWRPGGARWQLPRGGRLWIRSQSRRPPACWRWQGRRQLHWGRRQQPGRLQL